MMVSIEPKMLLIGFKRVIAKPIHKVFLYFQLQSKIVFVF